MIETGKHEPALSRAKDRYDALSPPAVFSAIGLLAIVLSPLVVLLSLPVWTSADARWLVLGGAIPLFSIAAVVPVIIARVKGVYLGPLLLLTVLAYFISFGVSGLLTVMRPSAVSFPNYSNENLLPLARGLVWCSLGILALHLGYLMRSFRERSLHRAQGPRITRLGVGGTQEFFVFLYVVGWGGRLLQIRSGAATYLYNSPAFDQYASRGSQSTIGFTSLVADLCLVAIAGLYFLAVRTRRLSLLLLLPVLVGLELTYFSFGLYKYGLLSVAIVPLLVFGWQGKRKLVVCAASAAVVILVVGLPLVNAARGDLLNYNKNRGSISASWFNIASGSLSTNSVSSDRSVLDQLTERFNGPQALYVASTSISPDLVWGRTYANIPTFLVPGALRPKAVKPFYVPWETNYVGFSPSNPTVVPMPAVVEAYINFWVPGVLLVMFLIGYALGMVETVARTFARNAVVVSMAAYAGLKLLNIEQNIFIVLNPVIKMTALVISLAWIFSAFVATKDEA